jgi:hypothetical protein
MSTENPAFLSAGCCMYISTIGASWKKLAGRSTSVAASLPIYVYIPRYAAVLAWQRRVRQA